MVLGDSEHTIHAFDCMTEFITACDQGVVFLIELMNRCGDVGNLGIKLIYVAADVEHARGDTRRVCIADKVLEALARCGSGRCADGLRG